jgi:hypothetical protein
LAGLENGSPLKKENRLASKVGLIAYHSASVTFALISEIKLNNILNDSMNSTLKCYLLARKGDP